ncbi:MAG TPA: oxygen-independent coproporphyrinogen III oxidase, partial [Gemmataceae bacterium]|nr:oxygen-independent coproporphyrinogen III oxidase [Gemmataceae bacterium]
MAAYLLTPAERAIYRRYAGLALPRHTSYPTAPAWQASYGAPEFRADLERSTIKNRPLSVYVHVPYCERLCYYCACTKEIVPPGKHRQTDPAPSWLDSLEMEINRVAAIVGNRSVDQLHLGGGSPTFLSADQLERLGRILSHSLRVAPTAEMAVEIDPRITSREQLQVLRKLGFNRVSLGIQDFDPKVQQIVNRLQPLDVVQRVVTWCRELGFGSINFDLIYGLPLQTFESLEATLAKTIALQPDRIAFYRLAVIPEIFRWQNVFHPEDLPGADLCLDLNLLAINQFQAAGYEFIGLDHFARTGEALTTARQSGTLQRNFQGMSTGKGLDLIGLGPSAISMLDDVYAQSVKTTEKWALAVQHELATERGLRLDNDDRLRRELLQQLYGHGCIDKRTLEADFGIDFDTFFASELTRLDSVINDGLATVDDDTIRL